MSEKTAEFIELTVRIANIEFSSRMSLLQWKKHRNPQGALEQILKDICKQIDEAVAENESPLPLEQKESLHECPPKNNNRSCSQRLRGQSRLPNPGI
jgi:hypothetical protein